MTKKSWVKLYAAASLLAIGCAMPAVAEEDADTEVSDLELGRVTVTAQRRAEREQDVPMSITAMSADELEKSGVSTTADLAKVSPGVTIPFYGAFMQPSVRGVSSTGANIGDNSNVALYLDGVYQPQQIAGLIDLPDVESVQILKGPQGTLYGQNATGGAILVTSVAPLFETTGKLSAGYGNYNDVQVRGYVTGPLADKVAGSLSGGFQNRDGFREHVITGERDKGLDSKVIRGKLLYTPTEDMAFTLNSYYADREDSSAYAGFAYEGNSLGYALIPTAPKITDADQFATNPDVFSRTKSHGGSLKAEFDFDAGVLTSITGYSFNETRFLADADFSPVNFAEAFSDELAGEYFTQEVNFVSEKSGRFSYLLGGVYMSGEETFKYSTFRMTQPPTLPPAEQNPYVLVLDQYGQIQKTILAAYGEFNMDLTDRLVLSLGGRYTEESQKAFSNEFVPNEIVEYPQGEVTFDKFSPRITLRYAVTPESNVYASWGEGFKSGIINTSNFSQDPVDPEVISAFEVGYKGVFNNVFSLDVAAFTYDYQDLQVVAYNPPDYIQQNAASASINGLEVNADWAVTSGFTLSGGISLLDAEYDEFPAAQVFLPTGFGNIAVTRDLGGQEMQRAPEVTARLAANYSVELSSGTLGAVASVYHNSGSGFEVSNRVGPDAYTTLDGELSFAPAAWENMRFVLWGKNLSDEVYLGSFLISQFADGVTYAPPRTFGVRAEYKF